MDSPASGILLSALAASIGIAGAALGVSSAMGAPRKIVPFSGGLLMGIAAFGVLPELAEQHGWPEGILLVAAGVAALWLFGRYIHPVCPSCSHTHDHDHCATVLHGFAPPLVMAAALHSFLDGIGVAASQQERGAGLAAAVLFAVVVHKIPEGIALGIMLRASVRSRWSAFLLCAAAELATLAGGLVASALAERGGAAWLSYALALAGGSFLYLGFHAVHGEWRRRGAAFMPALTGAAGAAALQQGVRALFR